MFSCNLDFLGKIIDFTLPIENGLTRIDRFYLVQKAQRYVINLAQVA